MDQRWVLAVPALIGLLMILGGVRLYGRRGEQLKGTILLKAFGPGVITFPICVGISFLLFTIGYFAWPVTRLRDIVLTSALVIFALGWLSFAWSPKRLLPKWLQPLVRTPRWVAAIGRVFKLLVKANRKAESREQ